MSSIGGASAPAFAPRLGLLSSALPGAAAGAVCDAASAVHLEGVEWAFGPAEVLRPDDAERVAPEVLRAVAERGLRVCGLAAQAATLLCHAGGDAGRAVELAATLGAPHLRVFAPPYAGGDVTTELAALRSTLAAVAAHARAAGVRLLVELSPGTLLPGPAWFLLVADGLDETSVGVVYDPGSMLMEGHVRPSLTVAALGRRVGHVHVKDVAPRREPSGWRWGHVPLGEGMVPWTEVRQALAGVGFGGWLVVDHLGGEPTAAQLRADVAALRDLLDSSDGKG